MQFNPTDLNTWLDDDTVAAIIVAEQLEPVGDAETTTVIFPPTFRGRVDDASTHVVNPMRNRDTGTEVLHVTLDTPQSQANRMEPIFKGDAYRDLVPQISIERTTPDGEVITLDLLEVGHRIADAGARHTEAIGDFSVTGVLEEFSKARDIRVLAKVAPTALLLGFWDSRGTGVKWPRVINSTIEAEGVGQPAKRGFSYNPAFDPHETLTDEDREKYGKKGAGDKAPLSQEGLAQSSDVTLGGVLVDSSTTIRRRTILNMAILRRTLWDARDGLLRAQRSKDAGKTKDAQQKFDETLAAARYLLGLALVMVTAPLDGNLRQGCLLVRKEEDNAFSIRARCFDRSIPLTLTHEDAMAFACKARDVFFKDGFPAPKTLVFSNTAAIEAMKKKDGKEADGGDDDADKKTPKKNGVAKVTNGARRPRSEVGAS